jgi:hypothetical protein
MLVLGARRRRMRCSMAAVHRTGVQHARIAEDGGEPDGEQRVDEAGEESHETGQEDTAGPAAARIGCDFVAVASVR